MPDLERCRSTAPDLWTIQCDLATGHDGKHRNNMVTWDEPQIVYIDGAPADTSGSSDHWVDGNVVLSSELHDERGVA